MRYGRFGTERVRVWIGEVDVAEVSTPLHRGHGATNTRVGFPDHVVELSETRLVLVLDPVTATQLYFDGVLPSDRTVPVAIRIGRRKATSWRVRSISVLDQLGRYQVRLEFERT